MKKSEKPMQLPPEAQQMLMQLQVFRQQMQSLAMQKEGMHIQKLENEKAIEELGKTKESEEVFKAVGPILIKSSKTEMEKELKERNETIERRLKAFESQEKSINEKAADIQKKLQEMLTGAKQESGPETAG